MGEAAAGAAALTLAVFVPGWLWTWLWPSATAGRLFPTLLRWGLALLLGLIVNAWGCVLAGSLGVWSATTAWSVALACAAAGVALGRWRRRPLPPGGLAGLAVCTAFCMAVLLWNPGSEWVLGGWDPGVYVNEGLLACRTGSFAPPPDAFYRALGPEALRAVATDFGTHWEMFPGVPLNIERAALEPAFPRLTSAVIAVVARFAGPAAAPCAPTLLAALALLLLGAGLAAAGAPAALTIAALLCVGCQPVFLFHAHTPGSELPELILVIGLAVCIWQRPQARAWTGLAALLTLTAAANRLSFFLFGALLALLWALADCAEPSPRRGHAAERLALAAALLAGSALHRLLTPVAVLKLAHVLPRLHRAGAGLLIAALALDAAGHRSAICRMFMFEP